MDKDREAGLRFGKSRMQKGGDNVESENLSKPETARPRPGPPSAEAMDPLRVGKGSTLDPRDRREEILKRFDTHAIGESQGISIARLRMSVRQMAGVIDDEVPPGREKSVALRKLEEALFWADAGVARNEGRPKPYYERGGEPT